MNSKLANEIQAEQEHGRQKYGRHKDDFEHDDRQLESIWHDCIQDHNNRAREATPMECRQHLVKIAGLAVSAIESFDRKRAKLLKEEGVRASFTKRPFCENPKFTSFPKTP